MREASKGQTEGEEGWDQRVSACLGNQGRENMDWEVDHEGGVREEPKIVSVSAGGWHCA